MFANILLLILSVFVLAFIKKVFYKQAAFHPCIFTFLVYYPIMILLYLLLSLALAEEGASVPKAYFASTFIAYLVFTGGRKTRRMVENHHDSKCYNRILQDRDRLADKLRMFSTDIKYEHVDFMQDQFSPVQLANAIYSLNYISESSITAKSCITALDYLRESLSFISDPNFDINNSGMILSYLNSTSEKYFWGYSKRTRRSFKYVLLFNKDNNLIIGPHNFSILDD